MKCRPAYDIWTWLPVFLTTFAVVFSDDSINPEADLLNWLFSHDRYNPQARPVAHQSDVLTVDFSFSLGRVESLDEKTQMLTTFGWLHMTWSDHFLKWNPREHSDISRLVVDTYFIWMPEIVLLNSVHQGNDISMDTQFRAIIRDSGLVKWVPGFCLETSCVLDLTYFPFDVQTCHVNITNWSFSTNSVNFTASEEAVSLRYYKPNAEWELVGTCMGRNSLPKSDDSLDGESSNAPLIYVTLTMQRRPVYYVLSILVPCTVMTLASVLVFVLPCDSGEKVSLAISVLLSYTVLMVMISENMPKSSDTIAVLAAFLTVNVVLTTVSLLLTVITLNVHNRSPQTPIPHVVRVIFLQILARVMLMTPDNDSSRTTTQQGREKARQADSKGECKCTESMVDGVFVDNANSAGSTRKTERFSFVEANGNSWRVEESPFHNDWRRVSAVLDRFFLVVYAVTVIAVSIAMLASVRRRHVSIHECG